MTQTRRLVVTIVAALLLLTWSMPTIGFAAEAQSEGLSVSIQSPRAASATVRLTFNNKTGAVLAKLVLRGPRTYTYYNVPQGKSIYQIDKGTYTFEYTACGAKKVKKVNIQSNNKFTTVTCQVAKVSVQNNTGGTMYMSLAGPAPYRFVLPPGTTRITVLKGTYNYTVTGACGGTSTGKVTLKGRGRWTWWCR
jgi:hypothetical protein